MLNLRTRRKKVPAHIRFFRYVKKSDGCWAWTGALTSRGYGNFQMTTEKQINAHRYSFELHKYPIPKDYTIDHLCRNKVCVNPHHLEAVTIKENIQRAMREACMNGHLFDAENTYFTPDGHRQCRICLRRNSRNYKRRQKYGYYY